jgi:SAM-dependent methyltransferase
VTTPQGQPRDFWEQRLSADWTESGVGYGALGLPFNVWMYRVRREVFLREAAALDLDPASARVLDVGSGTGFYVQRWQELGVRSLTGCDLTQAAVDRLRDRYPDVGFHRLDLSEPIGASGPAGDGHPPGEGDSGPGIRPGSFDAVSCMDVLFHIVDDDRYRAAIENLAALVRPGGWVVLSENFLHRAEQRGPHQVNRSLERITHLVETAGLEVVRRAPMLVLMNAQVDANWLYRKLWGGLLRAVTLTAPTGRLVGAALYPLERQLVRQLRESPTTEIMICRRR